MEKAMGKERRRTEKVERNMRKNRMKCLNVDV